MDNYTNSVVPLDGGLDLVTAKPAAQPGTLFGCLNFEVVDRSGYKSIDGFEYFDGRYPLPYDAIEDWASLTLRKLTIDADGVSNPEALNAGAVLTLNDVPFGLFVLAEAGLGLYRIFYRLLEGATEPTSADNIVAVDYETYDVIGNPTNPTGPELSGLFLAEINPNYRVEDVNFLADYRRLDVTALQDTAIGLHWFRNKLYAVVDHKVIGFTSGGTTELLIGDIIEDSANNQATIIDIDLDSGTWAGGDAAGTLLVSVADYSGFASGNIDLVRPNTAEITNVATIAATSTAPWGAGL
jgi:hypothetical protein